MRKSRLSKETIELLITLFIAGTSARSTAKLCSINPNTAIQWYHQIRIIIHSKLTAYQMQFDGDIEADESYFGGRRKGKRGRGAGGKTIVFGLYKRNGYVYTVIISKTKTNTLYNEIVKKVKPDSIVYTDTYHSYDILDSSEFKHYRINHRKEFARGRNHINEIENFWNQVKRHLRIYNGIPKQYFELYLKECEFRFNYRPIDNMRNVLYNWIKEAGLV